MGEPLGEDGFSGASAPSLNGPKGVHTRLPRGARVARRTSAAGVAITRSHLTPSFTGRFFPDWQQPARAFSRDARGWLPRARRPAPRGVAPTYRGPQQALPGSPTSTFVRLQAARADNPRKLAETHSQLAVRERTGVPSKCYRGPQQALPGSPTKTTGVPDKCYRGPQQALPGSPTKTTGVPDKPASQKLLQNRVFCPRFWSSFVFVSLVVLCC